MNELQTRFTTEGLVIKVTNVGESDRLVTLFTREYGIIKAFASGAKNIKSKKGAATSLLTFSSFTILHKKGTNRIYEAAPIAQFFTMGSDIEVLFLTQYFCELALVFGIEETPNPELLRIILNSLHFVTKKQKDLNLIKAITELRIASICGYKPDLIACENCAKFEDNTMFFDMKNGFLKCSDCANNEGYPLDRTLVSAIRHIVFSEFERLYSFEIPEASAKALSVFTEKYITHQTDYKFSVLKFF